MIDSIENYHAPYRRLDLGMVIGKQVRHHSEHRTPFATATDLFLA